MTSTPRDTSAPFILLSISPPLDDYLVTRPIAKHF